MEPVPDAGSFVTGLHAILPTDCWLSGIVCSAGSPPVIYKGNANRFRCGRPCFMLRIDEAGGGFKMRRTSLAFAVLLVTPLCQGQQADVYKCLRGKEIVYIDEPCPATHRTDKVFSYPSPHNARRAAQERHRIQAEMDRRNAAQRASNWQRPTIRSYDRIDCNNAKARRQRQLEQIGTLRVSPDQHQELCRPVFNACGYCD